MQVNPTQPQPVKTYTPPVKSQVAAPQSSSEEDNQAAASPATAVTSGNTDKIQAMVQSLLSQSNIRPEAIQGRSASDPAKAPSDEQLQSFIKALKQEPR